MNFIPLLLAVPLCGALCTALCGKKYGKLAHSIALAAEAATLVLSSAALFSGHGLDACALPLTEGLSFASDGFRLVWVLLVSFAFTMSGLMCPEYLSHSHAPARYQAATLLTLAGTLGVFLSADLFTFFVCFELMSLSSWLWVIHEETDGAKYAANTYLAVAVLGGLVMLMGIFTLGIVYGGIPDFESMRYMSWGGGAPLYLAGGLMLFGFAAKAGLFPLHFWLPMAHPVAPAPASALLSGVLTKCGVLGMLMLAVTLFRDNTRWGEAVLGLGVVTMVLGALLAVCSVDLKRTLACSSVSQIGFISVGVGLMSMLGTENVLAVRGTVLHMVNHTLIKLVLFLAAGVFAMNRGTLDLNRLRGAGRGNRLLTLTFLTGAYSVAGIPGGSGYLSKTMLHEAIVEYTGIVEQAQGGFSTQMHAVEWLFLFSGGLTLAYMLKLFITLFVCKPDKNVKLHMNDATRAALVIPSVILWGLGLAAHPVTDKYLDFAQPAFSLECLTESLRYFSLTNLTGACISIGIGLLVYFLAVRPLLTREGKLVNVIPAWCDLERKLYRPLFLRILPGVAGLLCRLLDNLLDSIVYLLRKGILCDLGKPKRPVAGLWLTDSFGRLCDGIISVLNRTVRRKKPIKRRRSLVYVFAEREREFAASGRLITASLSYGMLLACVGLVATLLYLLF